MSDRTIVMRYDGRDDVMIMIALLIAMMITIIIMIMMMIETIVKLFLPSSKQWEEAMRTPSSALPST